MSLDERRCKPCEEGIQPVGEEEANLFIEQLRDWTLCSDHILREYSFKDFKTGLWFVNEVGKIAEAENHHPDVYLSWGKVRIKITTHAIGGLSENDFILAAKINRLTMA